MRHNQLLSAGLLFSALLLSSASVAQNASNAENCVDKTWGYLKAQGYQYSAVNLCDYALTVSMMTGAKKLIEQTVPPGESFPTGLTFENFEATRKKSGWIATVCKRGETPSLNVSTAANWNQILKANYECRKP